MLNAHPDILARKRHQTRFSTVGDPDIVGCVRRRIPRISPLGLEYIEPCAQHFEIEMKKLGEKPEPIQYERMAEWEKYGAWVTWATNKEEVREFFKSKGVIV
jgi:hypothetical protein